MHPQQQLALALFAYAAQRGIATSRLEAVAGIRTAALLDASHGPLTEKQWHDLWGHAVYLTKDAQFGLHFGEAATPAALGVVGQLLATSRTVGEALTHGAALLPLLTTRLWLEVTPPGTAIILRLRPTSTRPGDAPELLAHLRDFFLAFVLHELDGLVLERIQPRRVWFPPEGEPLPEHGRVLRNQDIRTGPAGIFTLEFASRYWALPLLTVNHELQAALLAKVDESRRAPLGSGRLRDKVSAHLLANSHLGLPTLEALAANFYTSPRSLQRHLRTEGVTFQAVVDDVRRSLALHYLQTRTFSLKDIAYMLGYNEFSAFGRAVKRWTGRSPGQYQAALSPP